MQSELDRIHTLPEIQAYLNRAFVQRGFEGESSSDKMLLLVEEVGELAKAIRKNDSVLGVDMQQIENYHDIVDEVADVFIVLISICNILNIDLLKAVVTKERKNEKRKWNK